MPDDRNEDGPASKSRAFSRRRLLLGSTTLAVGASLRKVQAQPGTAPGSVDKGLPLASKPFEGKIDENYKTSTSDFPQPTTPPKGAPNVLLVLIDDLGFAGTQTFGGLVPTPNFEAVASQGLIYNALHNTALCSPTRAALLTGRNHHQVGMGSITELATGYPGYDSVWGQDNASIAEVLRYHGYATAMVGKWHDTPDWETSAAGPFYRWPTGKGFRL
jgi:Sulfatase